MEPSIELSQEFLLRPTVEEYSLEDKINILQIHDMYNHLNICRTLNDSSKNNNLSLVSRKHANELFIKKSLNNETLIAYNESIAYAECKNNTEFLSISFANRSALLYEMGYFKECIQDITRARSYNYPKHLLPKLEKRYEQAKKNEANSKVFTYHQTIPTMKSSTHKFLKCASDAIDIEYNDQYGRNIIATRDIDVGDVLTIEEPYAKYLLYENRHEYCNYCFEKTLTLIPCDHCCDAMFCNEICKNIAWDKGIHKYMCKISTSIVEGHSPPVAMAFYAAIQDLFNIFIDKENEKQPRTYTDAKVHGLTIRDGVIVHDVEREYSENLNRKRILGMYCPDMAILLRLIETRSTFFNDLRHHFSAEELKKKIIDFTYSHISMFSPMDVVSFKNNCFGAAMMPFGKLINHSCFRNVTSVWYGSTNVMQCVRPIKRHESIFCSYIGGDYAAVPKSIRQTELYELLRFECKCVACLQNWPLNDCLEEKLFLLVNLVIENPKSIADYMLKFNFKIANEKLKNQLMSYPPNAKAITMIRFISECLVMIGNNNSF